jgi:uracil-DNA glycosylase family 4
MKGRPKILGVNNGSIEAKVVLIGEAPGRLGADRTQVPFSGDQTGKNFERLLGSAGLSREEVFITNAVLCNPRDSLGNNATPTRDETRNCSLHLSLVLEIVQPNLVVTLGQWALNALQAIEPHRIELKRDVCTPVRWHKYTLLPLYHPSPRALVHRSFNTQIGDFHVLGNIISPWRMAHQEQA